MPGGGRVKDNTLGAYDVADLREIAIKIYRDEIDRLLALIGCPGVASLSRDYVVTAS